MEELRRGPWTVEEDLVLINYVTQHGEGRWNAVARCAGLRRTGKSCRLRWLNYLRPDVRRGNITPEEHLVILELHSRWGNRWSKIARFLPGRTDNEIKNYWRTRVQKLAKQLRCDVNSKAFQDGMRHLWMPRLLEQGLRAASGAPPPSIVAADPPPLPCSLGGYPEVEQAAWSSSSTSSEDTLLPTAQPSSFAAQGVEVIKCDEEILDVHGGWAAAYSLTCPMSYGGDLEQGGWDLLSGDYLWGGKDNWSLQQ